MKDSRNIIKEGTVTEALPDTTFKVAFDDDSEALAKLSGKMRFYKIKILVGDKVKVEFTPYDEKRGRIIYRSK